MHHRMLKSKSEVETITK